MFKIIDDFLDINKFSDICDVVHGQKLDWRIGVPNPNSQDDLWHALHQIVREGGKLDSPHNFMVDYLVEATQKIFKKSVGILRFRVNLFAREQKPIGLGYHTDWPRSDLTKWKSQGLLDDSDIFSLLLYLEDSNGKTEFKDVQTFSGIKMKAVESISNRALIFPANCEHQTLMHTDILFRTNINMNFKFYDN